MNTLISNVSLTRPDVKTPAQIRDFAKAKERFEHLENAVDSFISYDDSPRDLHSESGVVVLDRTPVLNRIATGYGKTERYSTHRVKPVEVDFESSSGAFTYRYRAESSGDTITYRRDEFYQDKLSESEQVIHNTKLGTITYSLSEKS